MAVFTVKDLKNLLEEGKKQNHLLASRIDNAAMIYLTRKIIRVEDDEKIHYKVESESEPNVFYDVIDNECSCSDFIRKRAPAQHCKHKISVMIVEKSDLILKNREENERKAGVRIFEEF